MNELFIDQCPIEKSLRAKCGLGDGDFAYHESDLYVVWSPEVWAWLRKNYQFFRNVQSFTSQQGSNWNGAGKTCLDIPFARMDVILEAKTRPRVFRQYMNILFFLNYDIGPEKYVAARVATKQLWDSI